MIVLDAFLLLARRILPESARRFRPLGGAAPALVVNEKRFELCGRCHPGDRAFPSATFRDRPESCNFFASIQAHDFSHPDAPVREANTWTVYQIQAHPHGTIGGGDALSTKGGLSARS